MYNSHIRPLDFFSKKFYTSREAQKWLDEEIIKAKESKEEVEGAIVTSNGNGFTASYFNSTIRKVSLTLSIL